MLNRNTKKLTQDKRSQENRLTSNKSKNKSRSRSRSNSIKQVKKKIGPGVTNSSKSLSSSNFKCLKKLDKISKEN